MNINPNDSTNMTSACYFDYYPYLNHYPYQSYPDYSYDNKTERAFKIIKVLLDENLIRLEGGKQFISLMDKLIEKL